MHKTATIIGLMVCVATFASAQQPGNAAVCVVNGVPRPDLECGPRPPDGDPLARYLFPPELVMANQQAINLTDRQRSELQQAMKDAQGKFIDLQFRMSGEVESLQRLIQASSVDEAKVLGQVDRVLAVEREVKHVQLSVMIRIKNLLTEQQQARLGALRRQDGFRGP